MPFSAYRDNFEAETLAILEAAFNEAWEVVTASGGDFVGREQVVLLQRKTQSRFGPHRHAPRSNVMSGRA